MTKNVRKIAWRAAALDECFQPVDFSNFFALNKSNKFGTKNATIPTKQLCHYMSFL
jgi:hypothetical protein